MHESLDDVFASLSTALIADTCVRLGETVALAPPGLSPVVAGHKVAGRVLPVRHNGSVDVFLEACTVAEVGEVLVIDNGGRADEGCIGDLTVLEAQSAGIAGVLVWGFHRDTHELAGIGLPVFSYGRCPVGPLRLDPDESGVYSNVGFGELSVGSNHAVFADDDGAVFVALAVLEEVLATAAAIGARERTQADLVRAGTSLRDQLRFDDYLKARSTDPSYTFRQHLRAIGGAIEE
ncbi:MAG: RraA family protein [Actinomycetia bacterium]|nr:RraA family protein [Actinomycetes bacterium]